MTEETQGERIAKAIARAGLGSRRDAERWIAAGRVALDGRKVESAATLVTPDQVITIDGSPLPPPPEPRLWRFHKPDGVLTTARDPEGRRTIYDLLPRDLPRVMPVGRLDMSSEGLLLLTNDGALKRRLELPASGLRRRYRVRAYGRTSPERLAELARGLTLDGIHYGPIEARLDRQSGANTWLTMTLREGKNREVRKVCAHIGLKVNRLIRVGYGSFQIGRLKPGELAEVPKRVLAEQLGDGPPEKAQRRGFARAKPKPVKPGHRKAAAAKRAAKAGKLVAGKAASGKAKSGATAKTRGRGKAAAKPTTARKRSGKHANRRRTP